MFRGKIDNGTVEKEKKEKMADKKLMPKKNIKVKLYHLTIEQKKKICEWKRDSPAKSTRTLAEEASAIFGRVVPHQTVSRVLQKMKYSAKRQNRVVLTVMFMT